MTNNTCSERMRVRVLSLFTGAGVLLAMASGQAADPAKTAGGAPAQEVLERGSYLVHRVAMCVQCHSPRNRAGDLLDHGLLKGAVMPLTSPFPYQVWAFQAPPLSGLPSGYTEAGLARLLSQGLTPREALPRHPMPPYQMSDSDARAVAAYLAWSGTQPEIKDISSKGTVSIETVSATLNPLAGGSVSGTVTFTWNKVFIHIAADLSGLTPGLHGFDILESGECGTAGGHFNPGGKAHGAPNADLRHLGDLGNLVADETGRAHYERFDAQMSLSGTNSIVGRCVVVRERMDDLKTQPDGGAGKAIACGVIDRR